LSAGASPQDPPGKLTALPQIPYLYLGGLLLNGEEGMKRGREERKGRGRGERVRRVP